MAWKWLSMLSARILGWLKRRKKHVTEYGVAMHHYIHTVDQREADETDARALDKMGSKNCLWFRTDFYWNFPANVPHEINRTFLDDIHGRGKKVIYIIDGWSCPVDVLTSESKIRAHIAKIVAQCPDADAWEIWNEINIIDFQVANSWLDGDPANYIGFLQICSEEIRKVSTAPILTAGLSPGATGRTKAGCFGDTGMLQFLQTIVDGGAMQYVDKVGFHYYNPDYTYAVGQFLFISQKPVWCTEVGYPATWWDGSQRESEQAQAVRDWMSGLAGYCEVVCWYDMMDYITRSPSENSFGLLRTDYSNKPSYDAFPSGGVGPSPGVDTIIMALALTFAIGFVYFGGPRQIGPIIDDVFEGIGQLL